MSLPSALADGSIRIKYYGFSQKRNSAKASVIANLTRWLKPTAMNYIFALQLFIEHIYNIIPIYSSFLEKINS